MSDDMFGWTLIGLFAVLWLAEKLAWLIYGAPL
jgi:hypothetical protein